MYLAGFSAVDRFQVAKGQGCPPGYALSKTCSTVDGAGNCMPYAEVYYCIRTSPDVVPGGNSPVNVTVSPKINTQVNPQISPVLTQQQQPTNSPVGASTSQTTGTTSPAQQQIDPNTAVQIAAAQRAEMQEFMEQQAARDEAMARSMMQPIAPTSSVTVIPGNQSSETPETPTASFPTPFGPISFPAESVKKTLPWIALGAILIYIARKHRS